MKILFKWIRNSLFASCSDAVGQNQHFRSTNNSRSSQIGLLQWSSADEKNAVEHFNLLPSMVRDIVRSKNNNRLQLSEMPKIEGKIRLLTHSLDGTFDGVLGAKRSDQVEETGESFPRYNQMVEDFWTLFQYRGSNRYIA